MTHDFLLKARSNPDLQDFCEYLERPLQILEELDYRYKQLPLDKKVLHDNMNTHMKIDKILNHYLPNMVDNYCDFSLKYRNENFVKTEQTSGGEKSYTAKELLLQNLSKLIEEIKVLEEEFNLNNKFKLLVQEKVLTNLGYGDLDLDVKPQVELKNKFKYNNEVFKKTEVVAPVQAPVEAPDTTIETSSGGSFSLIELLLVAGFISLGSIATYTVYAKSQNQNQVNQERTNLDALNSGIKNLYAGKNNYSKLNNEVINNARVTPDRMLQGTSIKNVYGGLVEVSPAVIMLGEASDKNSKEASGFKIVYNDVPKQQCNLLVEKAAIQFISVKVGEAIVKDLVKDQDVDRATVEKNCGDSNQITFTSL